MKALSKDAKLVRSTNIPREIWVLRTVGSKGVEYIFSLPGRRVLRDDLPARSSTRYVVFFPLAVLLEAVLLTGMG